MGREITLRMLTKPTDITFEDKVRQEVMELRRGIEGRVFALLYALNETGVSR